MIKEIQLRRWKSFEEAQLFIDPLTILIGTNAGGKSNALDSLRFLQRIGSGRDLSSAILGESAQPGIRGGVDWVSLKPYTSFELNATIQTEGGTDFQYLIEVETSSRCELLAESLIRIKYRHKTKNNPYKTRLYQTDPITTPQPNIDARLYSGSRATKKHFSRSMSILSQIPAQSVPKEIAEGVEQITKALRAIFVLDPIPSHMRGYSPLADQLLPDGSNMAGVIAALPLAEKSTMETKLTEFVRQLPERDIRKVWAEPVGKFNSDAMLYCEEDWGAERTSSIVDARGMSDGTLRFVGILTALLTRPMGSLLVVEEVDNGLHPSRAVLLLKMLRQIGLERNIDVVVTTHNPALLDALEPRLLPFITVAHRDLVTGYSRLTLLEDVRQLPKLLAAGPLGQLATQGLIQQAVSI
jgi:hypothetical protein